MNSKTDKVMGTVKESAGKMTGDNELEAKGKAQKAAGNVKDAASNAVDHVKNAADKVIDHHGKHTEVHADADVHTHTDR